MHGKMNGRTYVRSLTCSTVTVLPTAAHCRIPRTIPLQFEEPAEALQALRTVLDVRRALALDWVPVAAQQRLDAFASDKGKAPAAEAAAPANGKSGGAKAAKAAAAQHPLAPPPEVLERLRRELRLSKLQAVTVWRALLVRAASGGLTLWWHSAGGHACRACRASPSRHHAVLPSLSSCPPCLTITPFLPAVCGGQGRGGGGGGRGQPRPRRPGGAAGGGQGGRARWVGGVAFIARCGQLLVNPYAAATQQAGFATHRPFPPLNTTPPCRQGCARDGQGLCDVQGRGAAPPRRPAHAAC